MQSNRFSRRTLIRTTAMLGAGLAMPLPRLVRAASPNGKMRFAGIGVNGMGWSDVSSIGGYDKVEVVGLCDIDTARFDKAAEKWPDAPRFQDFRQMFDKIGNQIDAVNVSIPDHMHAYVAMYAMNLGKHVYCEKPLTHTVWEARQMTRLAAKNKLVTRMGNQIHSRIEYRLGVRMLRDGLIGKVKEIHSWVGASGAATCDLPAPPDRTDPVPGTLDWDLWLGVAADRPFVNEIYHPFKWRAWKDFGGGGFGDFGCHILDPPFTALELTAPKTIVAEQNGQTATRWPAGVKATYIFPGTKFTAGETVKVVWYNGNMKPGRELVPDMPADQDLPRAGSIFIGEKGQMVLPHWNGPRIYPRDLLASYDKPDLGSRHHWHDWVDAVLTGDVNISDNFAYAGPLTETVNLGLIAVQCEGQTLAWDPAALKITNNAKANGLLMREYRKGFEIKAVD